MKVLIEIDEKFYQWVKMCGIMPFITAGKVIPDNATNEDVVNLIFPNGLDISDFHWWKAPYKGGE